MAAGAAALIRAAALHMCVVAVAVLSSGAAANWCVARSDASDSALQRALDYACGAGADCSPLQSTGLCYLPNTIAAHAAYAFNSFYQRNGACSFAGTSTIARTDPSYGSCVYPSSPRAAGVPTSTGTTTSPPPPPPRGATDPLVGGGGGGSIPDMGPGFPDSSSQANGSHSQRSLRKTMLLPFLLVFWFALELS
ncbi:PLASMODESMATA CALLOSE-BINDING PROTEIN 3-like [Andrographis paniculata]|uniref:PLASMODESMATA CALLOSE-BINDING PROTEIN 3-like n=1 Tax=Andrographis paniculata TaxID=175694 RepID=UPI0021E8CE48|nr:PLASMODESMATA CALLOSE-BINDING PROTEIN 3-like [Andrographis paniculata]